MLSRTLRANGLLVLTAIIWGFAFVAQRVSMAQIGPFAFNGLRFLLGSAALTPVLILGRHRIYPPARRQPFGRLLLEGGLAGCLLFVGASLQQAGLVHTTAGKAGFITGLYVILVPLLGLLWGQRVQRGLWIGASLAVIGLYLLSVTESFTVALGDSLVLASALFWALHVQFIGWLTQRHTSLHLAVVQFMVCALLSLGAAVLFEPAPFVNVSYVVTPLLYGGLLSVGIAYTLQVVAQRDAHPAPAAIIMSLEAVFAAIGGWLLLAESLSPRAIIGCVLMFCGMVLAQYPSPVRTTRAPANQPVG